MTQKTEVQSTSKLQNPHYYGVKNPVFLSVFSILFTIVYTTLIRNSNFRRGNRHYYLQLLLAFPASIILTCILMMPMFICYEIAILLNSERMWFYKINYNI